MSLSGVLKELMFYLLNFHKDSINGFFGQPAMLRAVDPN